MEKADVRVFEENKRLSQELYLCYCGHSVCQPSHSFGPAVRPNYILHYVLNGKGSYTIENRTYELEQEHGFLIEPNVMTFYQADDANPWTYVWIGFDGSNTETILRQIGLSHRSPTFSAGCGAQLQDIVRDILQCTSTGTELELFTLSKLYGIFSLVAHDISAQRSSFHLEKQNYYVQTAVEYIQHHYADTLRIQDIAAYVGVSRTYLATLFQLILHVTPNEYLTNFRLSRAKEQLTITDLSIGTISGMCGYRDPLVFSKAFKHAYGITPTQYRKTDREKQHIRIQKNK